MAHNFTPYDTYDPDTGVTIFCTKCSKVIRADLVGSKVLNKGDGSCDEKKEDKKSYQEEEVLKKLKEKSVIEVCGRGDCKQEIRQCKYCGQQFYHYHACIQKSYHEA